MADYLTEQTGIRVSYETVRHSVGALRQAQAQQTPHAVQEEVPVPLARLVAHLLAKATEDRSSMQEALIRLQQEADRLGQPAYAPPEVFAHTPEHERIFWDGWAVSYYRFKLYEEALARNERTYRLAPHDAGELLTQGNILQAMGRSGPRRNTPGGLSCSTILGCCTTRRSGMGRRSRRMPRCCRR